MLINNPKDFDFLRIGLASPDKIRFWSYGEIEKPETINYRTFKPERKGLFCEKIFGPVKDWECSCGKYRRVRYRGIVCERCGVEVTHSKVRRERMGHIELAASVAHIWFLKGIPSYIGLILEMTSRQLEEVVYYDSYIVVEADEDIQDDVQVKQILSMNEYHKLRDLHGNKFKVSIGAEAIKILLENINLEKLAVELREDLQKSKGQKRLKITRRLRIIESLEKSGNRPDWLILEAIPVMPPDLRPMVQLEGGRFATSDLNDLYRRVVNRNNRLKRLIDIGAPDMIVRNEKRMLQEAIDVLISNGKRGRSVTGSNGRPLKSLGNIIEGKQGRFRQNLLGKRVDYSARSVIVVGPHLKFYQCGLPKEMALELFKPFVIRKLVELGHVSNVKSAKRKIEKKEVVVWDVLEMMIKGQTVLLNRAPTLHRLGIQAFEPILVEGSAIQIHPLVCTAFNADFDGDQMAVHLPLSLEAQAESRLLIMSTNNILSPSNGQSIVTPTQDMILGCYFLTVINTEDKSGENKCFADYFEAKRAWETKHIGLQSEISVRIDGKRIKTSMGRIIFNETIWDVLDKYNLDRTEFINYIVDKKKLGAFVHQWYLEHEKAVVVELLDNVKDMGFHYSTISGISISIDDLRIPDEKESILEKTGKEVNKLEKLEKSESITTREKVLKSNDLWREATHRIASALEHGLGDLNNVYIMANSGARGNMDQVRQLAGMRGLMSDAQGRTVSIPIKANFKEGLSLTEYFISSYGARKGLVDTALRTADSGYLTRRLVDVAQDVMITMVECGTDDGLEMQAVKDGINVIVPLAELLEGRIAHENIAYPGKKKKIVEKGQLITVEQAKEIQATGRESVKVRSVYSCKAERGVCQKCYGLDLARGKIINVGEAIGIIAAQSIGEPGTQLTMRTFHTGGVDLRKAAKVDIESKIDGKISFLDGIISAKIMDNSGEEITISTAENTIAIEGENDMVRNQLIPIGATISVKEDQQVKKGQILAEYDPTFEYKISESNGLIKFLGLDPQRRKFGETDHYEMITKQNGEVFVYNPEITITFEVKGSSAGLLKIGDRIKADHDLFTNIKNRCSGIILEVIKLDKQTKAKKKTKEPYYSLVVSPGEAYPILAGSRIFVAESETVKKGEILAREEIGDLDASKTKDIVQGLPRVEELFEARKPKESAIISEYDGVVEISDEENYRSCKIMADGTSLKEYKVAYGVRLKIFSGKKIKKGDQISAGVINPHDILATKGIKDTQLYLSNEVQKVYRSQGVSINSKHIEVIVRQMTRKINITEGGESHFLPNELVDRKYFGKVNAQLKEEGKKGSTGNRVLLGITRASLNTDSFISASSFQQTASVLTKAAIDGQKDPMYGLKENVIIGKLIPAGTGMSSFYRVRLEPTEVAVEEDASEESDLLAEEQNEKVTAVDMGDS